MCGLNRNYRALRRLPQMRDAARIGDRHPAWLFAITFLFYVSTATGVLEFGDDWSMVQVTHSIVEQGTVRVPATTPGSASGRDGQHYSKYGLGQSVLAVPFYLAGTNVAALGANSATDRTGGLRQATAVTYMLT